MRCHEMKILRGLGEVHLNDRLLTETMQETLESTPRMAEDGEGERRERQEEEEVKKEERTRRTRGEREEREKETLD